MEETPVDGPCVKEDDFTERYGVLAVEKAVLDARCVWRETLLRDVGIDGQIEHRLPSGVVTGRLVAVQVKSGASYFLRRDETHVSYTPTAKHRAYWARHPLPVIVVLHEPATGRTVWTDARSQLRDGAVAVRVPLARRLDARGVLSALATDGPLPVERRSPAEVAAEMAAARHPELGFRLSYLDLFLGGLTDLGHSLYFGMALAHETQDVLAALPGGGGTIGIGQDEFAFLDDYVAHLISRDLARVDFDGWRRMDQRFGMVGQFVVPLTATGEELVAYLGEAHPDLAAAGLVRERSVSLRMDDIDGRVRLQLELARRLGHDPSPPGIPFEDASGV